MSVPEATDPEEFNDIFRQGVLVVGGHAVNLWASYYAHRRDRQLAAFAPFVSKDADIHLRDKEVAIGVAAAAGWQFRDNPEVRSPVLRQIVLVRSGKELTVDVLRAVTGLDDTDLTATEEILFADGSRYSVPAPEIMCEAKSANLLVTVHAPWSPAPEAWITRPCHASNSAGRSRSSVGRTRRDLSNLI